MSAQDRAEIDRTLARILQKIRRLDKAIPHRLPMRTRPFGPATFAHMTAGQLAGAALMGVSILGWSNNKQTIEKKFFEEELQRRDFSESLNTWRGSERSTNQVFTDLRHAETKLDSMATMAVHHLEQFEQAVDDVIFGDDGRLRGALTPAEVLSDLEAVGAPDEAIDAFANGVGPSNAFMSYEFANHNNVSQEETLQNESVSAQEMEL
ncbi:hypothetical protein BRL53_05240 [Corynebacterium ulcerans]|uniref:hypothetical protein n=1 Tax=Corynebacterium ulcerans TaxID=65058 RepID=UPI000C769267|nr:hypothetical protein [Corynebacterium ulcerans]PLW00139.1 hypothetical protein BRL53_05240 [Corynebacterium ulcerans]